MFGTKEQDEEQEGYCTAVDAMDGWMDGWREVEYYYCVLSMMTLLFVQTAKPDIQRTAERELYSSTTTK